MNLIATQTGYADEMLACVGLFSLMMLLVLTSVVLVVVIKLYLNARKPPRNDD